MTAPDRIALRWEVGAAVTSGPLMDHPDYTQYIRADLATPAAMTPEVRALVDAFNWQTKARAQHWLRRNMSAPEDAEVKSLCEKYCYGAVMDAASRLWARGPYGSGAFYVGGCIGFKSDEEALAALRKGGGA